MPKKLGNMLKQIYQLIFKMLVGRKNYEIHEKGKYHLYFVRAYKRTKQDKRRKTPIYIIRKYSDGLMAERLGLVKWYGAFRQFVFYPDENTCWSKSCLEIVNSFLDKVNKRYRNKLKKQKKVKDNEKEKGK